MSLQLASLNGRGLRSESKRAKLLRTLQHFDVSICCLQETHFIPSDCESILSRDFLLFSAYFDSHSRGVSWLISRSLNAACTHVYADPAGRLCVVDVTIKGEVFRLIGVYGPNLQAERVAFFRGSIPS